jgi:hypothetical protein
MWALKHDKRQCTGRKNPVLKQQCCLCFELSSAFALVLQVPGAASASIFPSPPACHDAGCRPQPALRITAADRFLCQQGAAGREQAAGQAGACSYLQLTCSLNKCLCRLQVRHAACYDTRGCSDSFVHASSLHQPHDCRRA